jgi:hypothetical protein
MILCAPDEDLQDLMLPFVESRAGREVFTSQIYRLFGLLCRAGFTHVVIDNSAELKELAIDATRLSSLHGGKTVFVTTLSRNAVNPLLSMLTSGHNIVGANYLVVNKLRAIDARYIDSKEGVIDYLNAREDSTVTLDDTRSYARLSALLNVRECGPLLWSEDLENLISRRREARNDVYDVMTNTAVSQIGFLLS